MLRLFNCETWRRPLPSRLITQISICVERLERKYSFLPSGDQAASESPRLPAGGVRPLLAAPVGMDEVNYLTLAAILLRFEGVAIQSPMRRPGFPL